MPVSVRVLSRRRSGQRLLWADRHAFGTFQAVTLGYAPGLLVFYNVQIKRASLFAFAAFGAEGGINSPLMLSAAQGILHCSHRAERTPCPWMNQHAEHDSNASGDNTHQPEGSSQMFPERHAIRLLESAKRHEAHQCGKHDPPQSHATQEEWDVFLSTDWPDKTVKNTATRTEVPTDVPSVHKAVEHAGRHYYWHGVAEYRMSVAKAYRNQHDRRKTPLHDASRACRPIELCISNGNTRHIML